MNSIELEPARYGITGAPCGVTMGIRKDFSAWEAVQPLDAPECVPRGSVLAGHITTTGKQYASTTLNLWARIFGGAQ
jgi:hypothetical protein